MFGLTAGELGLVVFIVLAIVTARYWPALGERLALLVAGEDRSQTASKREKAD